MTRINSGIDPSELVDQHLVAEYREIGRISILFEQKFIKGEKFEDIPKEFCLGKGHMSFFLDKGKFIHDRFESIKEEMKRRGFNTTLEFRNTWEKHNRLDMYKDFVPSVKVRDILLERIKQKMPKNPRYYRNSVAK